MSTHCFVNSKFVDTHYLKTSTIPPVALHLFDDLSNNIISKIANLPIILSTGDCINLDFYITLLDSFCSSSLWKNLAPSHIMANILLTPLLFLDISLQSLDSIVSIPASKTSMSNSK